MKHDTPLRRSIEIQIRVIGALLMREIITRYGRHNVGFVWLFGEPMMFTLGVIGLWTATKAVHGSGLPIAAFALSGYSSVLLWRNCVNRCCLAILPNHSLLFHRNVRVIDLFISRAILEIAGATISIFTLTILFVTLGIMSMPSDITLILMGWFLLAFFAIGLGFAIGALSERSEMSERIWHTVSYLLFALSGALFMVDWLPKKMQQYVLLLPMVHGVEMMRAGYFGELVKPHYSVSYVVIFDAILMLVGLFLVAETGKRVEPE
ncbi:sugar ABC transporter permease [Burkholderia pyrrocinia]|uniref:Transport permease protein n=1 Tax=Burkholderia pyrrocinia TaxID=60550 RepID=A0A2Z5MSF4_BURPY|nr:ABC transporter permease [Burkholderia pyrrocinia]AXF19734.1 sugar ABC transporter permease [Burkholderia pyrrocinia]